MRKMDYAIASKGTHHSPQPWFKLLIIYVPFVAAILFTAFQSDAPIPDLTRDIFVTAQVNSYVGLLSNLGGFAWCAATTVCGLGYLTLQGRSDAIARQFFLYTGCFNGILMLDDFFMFHEQYYQIYFNISEKLTYSLYAIAVIAISVIFRKLIRHTPVALLIIALGFFSMSIGVDLVESFFFNTDVEQLPEHLILFEDGSKLLGIVTWSIYLITVFLGRVNRAIP